MLSLFNRPWDEVPIVVIDVETTGTLPGVDAAVQVAIVRFEKREVVGVHSEYVNPGRKIPKESTAIHGITDKKVAKAATIATVFKRVGVRALLAGAQPAAYRAQFDQRFVPPFAFEDWTWPWLDPLVAVRAVDKYARGKGRHKLEAACARRGIPLVGAHDAAADATATGHLLYHVFAQLPSAVDATLGELLAAQARAEADQWESFNRWRAAHPED